MPDSISSGTLWCLFACLRKSLGSLWAKHALGAIALLCLIGWLAILGVLNHLWERVSSIVGLIPPNRWRHVGSSDNPADCASRGLLLSELMHYHIWWNAPSWLSRSPDA